MLDAAAKLIARCAGRSSGQEQHRYGGSHLFFAMTMNESTSKVSMINRYVQSLCGMYSRVARQLHVDRSYVSRVARGERRSAVVEHALTAEFDRITTDVEG